MRRRDCFSHYHPLVELLYFGLVIGFSMFLTHPVCLLISLVGGMCYAVSLKGARALGAQLALALPAMLMAALVNLLFARQGETVLARLPGGAALTLESALYGLAAAAMLWAVVTWFGCCNAVMTSDKLLYLFGRAAPSVALVLSMALGAVPRFKRRLGQVILAQEGLGRSVRRGPLLERLRSAVTILSVLLTWSLESGVATADSMRGRGYGLPGRTAFSPYRFEGRDAAAALWLLSCGFFLLCGWASGWLSWPYFPSVKLIAITPPTAGALTAYLALCLTPVILNGREALEWRRSRCAM